MFGKCSFFQGSRIPVQDLMMLSTLVHPQNKIYQGKKKHLWRMYPHILAFSLANKLCSQFTTLVNSISWILLPKMKASGKGSYTTLWIKPPKIPEVLTFPTHLQWQNPFLPQLKNKTTASDKKLFFCRLRSYPRITIRLSLVTLQ